MQQRWDGEDLRVSVPLSRNLLPTQAKKHCQIHVHILLHYFFIDMSRATFEIGNII